MGEMMEFEKMSENDIINLAQKRENAAMEYLLEKYKPLVRQKTRKLFLIDGDKDDLIQEGMIGLFKAVRDYQVGKDAAFRTFADLCISRQLYSAIKKSNRLKNQPLNSYVSIYSDEFSDADELAGDRTVISSGSDNIANPEAIMIDRENAIDMQNKMFDKLSKMEREVLKRYLEGMTYQEIAADMEKSPKSIDNALQRIKGKIG
jgi:RNA polymerase sporulation-specific sigma factor